MNWSVIGINYLKANVSQRQIYALNPDQIISIYQLLKNADIEQALIVSTCNRTEFFLPAEFQEKAIKIIQKEYYENKINPSLFHYKSGEEALRYFFRICSGLESQIAGDFEILGQVRKACTLAKQNGMLTGTWERLINNALNAAKKARTQTGYYSGASSTSYACIEYLKKANIDLKTLKYLILGAGKIGGHTVDHLLKLVEPEQLTICNRSIDKAIGFSDRKGLNILPFDLLEEKVQDFDVVICATNAPKFILRPEHFSDDRQRYIADLSVPLNVDPELGGNDKVELVNVDHLSDMINKNLKKRESEKEHVEQIIEESIQDLNAWYTIKSGMPMLSELKLELSQLKREVLSKLSSDEQRVNSEEFLNQYTDELFDQLSQQWIKKVRNMAVNAD